MVGPRSHIPIFEEKSAWIISSMTVSSWHFHGNHVLGTLLSWKIRHPLKTTVLIQDSGFYTGQLLPPEWSPPWNNSCWRRLHVLHDWLPRSGIGGKDCRTAHVVAPSHQLEWNSTFPLGENWWKIGDKNIMSPNMFFHIWDDDQFKHHFSICLFESTAVLWCMKWGITVQLLIKSCVWILSWESYTAFAFF